MKKLFLLFMFVLLFTTNGLTQYNTLWKNNVSYVIYIRPDSVTMDASHFIFTPSDTLESFFQAGKPNPLTPGGSMWLWFYEFNNNLQFCDSAVIICKLSLQIAPTGVVSYLKVSFYDKNKGNAYFSEKKILSSDYSLRKYVWVISKSDQQLLEGGGNHVTTMSMDILMDAYPLSVPLSYRQNTVDMSDLKLYRDGKVTFYEPFQPLTTKVEGKTQIPAKFSLSQNYPNPFNPATKIKFSVPSSQFVTLKIYDILGKEVATLLNEEKDVGNYEINYNASNLPSGVYVYRLTAGSFTQTKKMIFMK